MNAEELFQILSNSGIPFAYHVWINPPALPWGVYRFSNQTEFFADGIVYFGVPGFEIELYTDRKSPKAEKQLENALTEAGISFSKSEEFIESERLYEILYECEV